MRDTPAPAKFEAVAGALRGRIRSGEFAPGSLLPGQRVLSRAYDVSLMTLRRSLQLLEREGLVVLEPSRGTYVAPASLSHQLTSLHSLTDELRAQGVDLTTSVLDQQVVPLPADLAPEFGTPDAGAGGPALRLERVRRVGGRPIVHQVSWVPAPWARRLAGVDFTTTSLYGALVEHCGLAIGRAEESIRAGTLAPDLATRLGLDGHGPVLLMDRRTFDHRDVAVVVDRAQILDRRLSLTTQRQPAAVTVDWSYRAPRRVSGL